MVDTDQMEMSVSEFVAVFNQTLEFAYPSVTIIGELANLRISKNRWIYFDLKDENSSVKFFGTVYQLPGPLEDGMMLKVRGQPRLHNLYGFSVTVLTMQPAGEGSIRKAADLLKAKLQKEGLFEESRKRLLRYPPASIGLITSSQSAAYSDFTKVLAARWGGLSINLIDVQVQGESAPQQIVEALEAFNSLSSPPEVLVIIRGGGSPEDLAAFSTEQVTKAVAASRVPTMVAIGHEIDISLAELAADQRASTPSNAAELLVPDKRDIQKQLKFARQQVKALASGQLNSHMQQITQYAELLNDTARIYFNNQHSKIDNNFRLLEILNPENVLKRGYAVVRVDNRAVRDVGKLVKGDIVTTQLAKGSFESKVSKITGKTDAKS